MFSRRRTAPGASAFAAASGPGPTQSGANATGEPSLCSSVLATGASEYFGSGAPLAFPRCEARRMRAPPPSRRRIVGSASTTRVSSRTTPSLIGTLKSTRTKTRLPSRSRSRIEGGRSAMGSSCGCGSSDPMRRRHSIVGGVPEPAAPARRVVPYAYGPGKAPPPRPAPPPARGGRSRVRRAPLETAEAIRSLAVRGAPLIGVAAAFGLVRRGAPRRRARARGPRRGPRDRRGPARRGAPDGREPRGRGRANARRLPRRPRAAPRRARAPPRGRGGPHRRGGPRGLPRDRRASEPTWLEGATSPPGSRPS